jgi:type I restriction enzyme M protein
MYASLKDGGRMAVVLDTGSVSRGSGNQGSNREREIRKAFLIGDLATKGDLIEAIVLLPENLFYNTTSPGVILIINTAKRHAREILLINASTLHEKGRPKNHIEEHQIDRVAQIYHSWKKESGLSAVISVEEAVRNDFNISPSRYIASKGKEDILPLDEAVVLFREAEEERAEMDRSLQRVLKEMGL